MIDLRINVIAVFNRCKSNGYFEVTGVVFSYAEESNEGTG